VSEVDDGVCTKSAAHLPKMAVTPTKTGRTMMDML